MMSLPAAHGPGLRAHQQPAGLRGHGDRGLVEIEEEEEEAQAEEERVTIYVLTYLIKDLPRDGSHNGVVRPLREDAAAR